MNAPLETVAPPSAAWIAGRRWRTVRAWPRGSGHLHLELRHGDELAAGQWFAEPGAAMRAAARIPGSVSAGDVVLQPDGADARLPVRDVLARPGAELVSHRPGRRAVVRVTGSSAVEYVKVVRRSRAADYAERAARAERLLGDAAVVPRLLDSRRGVMRWADVGGRTLHDLGQQPSWDGRRAHEAWQLVGRALARLHASPVGDVAGRSGAALGGSGADAPDAGEHGTDVSSSAVSSTDVSSSAVSTAVPIDVHTDVHTVADELAAIDSWLDPAVELRLLDASLAARVRADVASRLLAGVGGQCIDAGSQRVDVGGQRVDVEAGLPDETPTPALLRTATATQTAGRRRAPASGWPAGARLGVLHRDLHDKQVLLRDDGRLAVIDVDTLAVGECALDVANVLAHLDLRVAQGLLSPAHARASRTGFLAGLGEATDSDAEDPAWEHPESGRLEAYLAATRLRLAAVYSFRPRWRSVAATLLEQSAGATAA